MHGKWRPTNLRKRRMMNPSFVSKENMAVSRSRRTALPSHCMPASCKSNRIRLVETCTRKTCQRRLQVGLWLANARRASLCGIYTPSTEWDWRAATSSDSHCRAKCYNIGHCCTISACLPFDGESGSLLETLALMKKAKTKRESLKATPTFSGRWVSNPMEASMPPVPAATSAVTKSSMHF